MRKTENRNSLLSHNRTELFIPDSSIRNKRNIYLRKSKVKAHTLRRLAAEMASNRILYRAFISGELPVPAPLHPPPPHLRRLITKPTRLYFMDIVNPASYI